VAPCGAARDERAAIRPREFHCCARRVDTLHRHAPGNGVVIHESVSRRHRARHRRQAQVAVDGGWVFEQTGGEPLHESSARKPPSGGKDRRRRHAAACPATAIRARNRAKSTALLATGATREAQQTLPRGRIAARTPSAAPQGAASSLPSPLTRGCLPFKNPVFRSPPSERLPAKSAAGAGGRRRAVGFRANGRRHSKRKDGEKTPERRQGSSPTPCRRVPGDGYPRLDGRRLSRRLRERTPGHSFPRALLPGFVPFV